MDQSSLFSPRPVALEQRSFLGSVDGDGRERREAHPAVGFVEVRETNPLLLELRPNLQKLRLVSYLEEADVRSFRRLKQGRGLVAGVTDLDDLLDHRQIAPHEDVGVVGHART